MSQGMGRPVPTISVQEVASKRAAGEKFVLLDVREPWELEMAHLGYSVVDVAPMSELAAQRQNALPPPARNKEAEIVVLCHHGVRSAQVAAWMIQEGWTNVKSMTGGIAAYAAEVDPTIGTY